MVSGEYDPTKRRARSYKAPDNLREIPQSRHPFQILMLAASALGGGSELFGIAHVTSVNEVLPRVIVVAWAAMLFFGGIVAIASAWFPDRVTGLLLERTSMFAVAAASVVYAIVLAGRGVSTASVVIAWSVGLALASLIRARDIRIELKKLAWWIDRVEG